LGLGLFSENLPVLGRISVAFNAKWHRSFVHLLS